MTQTLGPDRLDRSPEGEIEELVEPLARLQRMASELDLHDGFSGFLDQYYAAVPPEHLADCEPQELLGAAVDHERLLRSFDSQPLVSVCSPSLELNGWRASGSVVQVVAPDSPFVLDTVLMVVEATGVSTRLLVHPAVPAGDDVCALVGLHVDRLDDDVAAALAADLGDALADAATVVADWPAMVGAVDAAMVGASDQAARFLRWLADGHFVFLAALGPDLAYGLAQRARHLRAIQVPAPPDDGPEVFVTKSLARSPVHRHARLDLVVVTKGHLRTVFAGLFTADVYTSSVFDVPLIADVVDEVHRVTGRAAGTHEGNALRATIEGHPRDDLFELEPGTLARRALQLLELVQHPRDVRLMVNADRLGRTWSALVFVPRDRFDPDVRRKVIMVLTRVWVGELLEDRSVVDDHAHARLHLTFAGHLGPHADSQVAAACDLIGRCIRAWEDELRSELDRAHGLGGAELHETFRGAFPASYQASTTAVAAVADIAQIKALHVGEPLRLRVARELGAPADEVQLTIYHRGRPITLTVLLPILHNLGLEVIDERPFDVALPPRPDGRPVDDSTAVVHLLRLTARGWPAPTSVAARQLDADCSTMTIVASADDRFTELFRRVWSGEVEDDSLNRLGLQAGLGWREIVVVRSYGRYLRQIGVRFDVRFLADTLVRHAAIAADVVALFVARFDPTGPGHDAADAAKQRLEQALAEVPGLDEDRALRSLVELVMATVRTNHFQHMADGSPKPYLALKFDPSSVRELPSPRPRHEVFVYAAHCEGVHLRNGAVARGGLRHSDRLEDYRTEVLQLMKAQVMKNAVIVPTGAKGGFVCRRLPEDRGLAAAEVAACYRTFVCGLLDLTDNLVRGEVVHPAETVRHDDDDVYMVVAADKGTATFSDVANEIALARQFWLGDAFASGGSAGYDHKALGITARGAWISVVDHLAHRDVAIDQPFTVVGVGDMSGDVFGNGMLASESICLVAAFDHRHIFLDPDPDPAAGFAERLRLARLDRSSWVDYDPARLSPGGAVYSRAAKSLELSEQAWVALSLGGERRPLTPDEVIRAILRAPVDLLWNGGIGTYVKATTESHRDTGDKTNDSVRVDAIELRCLAVGEGGNLGLTQRARIEFAAGGGRVFSDAVDNSAGVNCSDHEVNVKILLDGVVREGFLTVRQRNELLASMADDVADAVLRSNREQAVALDNAVAEAAAMVDVHRGQIAELEAHHSLDRVEEALPDDVELSERATTGRGLSTPELAVLMAHTKNAITPTLADEDLSGEAYFAERLVEYFPMPLRQRFRSEVLAHPLRRELTATLAANRFVHRAGISMLHRLVDETAASTADVVRAHAAAWEVFEGTSHWDEVARLVVAPGVQTSLRLVHRRLVERSTRWVLRNRPTPVDVGATIECFGPAVTDLLWEWDTLLSGRRRVASDDATERWMRDGVPEGLARRAAAADTLTAALAIVEVARASGATASRVAGVHFRLEDFLGLDVLADAVDRLPRRDRWQSLARAALRDDLYAAHAALTHSVIEATGGRAEAADIVDAWRDSSDRLIGRWRGIFADLPHGGPPALDQLSVTVREFRNLLHHVASLGRAEAPQ